MKKIRKVLSGLACLFLIGLCGCSDDGSSSNTAFLMMGSFLNQVPAFQIPVYKADQIIKIKVANISDNSNEVYFEYLKFTDSTSGTYSLYKDGIKQDEYNGVLVPTTFTYDENTGKFSANGNSSYLFNGRKNGVSIPVIASEIMTTTDESPKLDSTWTINDGSTYSFNTSTQKATINKFSHNFETIMQINDCWFSAANEKFYFGDLTHFYYMAFETTKDIVEEIGRSTSDADVVYSSVRLFLVK